MSDVTDPTDTTILLDIYERLGTVEEQNRSILSEQARVRADAALIAQNVAGVAQDLAVAKQRVDTMEPDLKKLVGFRAQVAVVVTFVALVTTGAINMLVYGVLHIGEIKAALREFLS